jgi:Protein of unknown function (DUF2721)
VQPDWFVPEMPLIRALSPTLAVLTAMITPAVLMSACGTMILSTSSRLGRVVDRVRDLSDRFQKVLEHEQPTDIERETQRMILGQLGQFTSRARLLQTSLTMFYLALGVFIATSMMIGLVAIGWVRSTWLPMALSLVGMACMLVGSVLLIVEARHALYSVRDETEFLWQIATKSAPTGLIIPERTAFGSFRRSR